MLFHVISSCSSNKYLLLAFYVFAYFGLDSTGPTMASFHKNTTTNLTQITWAHAVNNRQYLNECLSGSIMMLEADIVLGRLIDNSTQEDIPIMGHPPATTSDISLEEFLTTILDFNNGHQEQEKKGVKLDFKTIEVFEKSVPIIEKIYPGVNYPFWINADILPGPLNATGLPVDSSRFLVGCKNLTKSTLSLGWTSKYGPIDNGAEYTTDQVHSMLSFIRQNNVVQPITFPVRAGITANSLENLLILLSGVEKAQGSALEGSATLTIWSSAADYVNVEKLRNVIFKVGLDRVYVDVPKDLADKLHLDVPPQVEISTLPK